MIKLVCKSTASKGSAYGNHVHHHHLCLMSTLEIDSITGPNLEWCQWKQNCHNGCKINFYKIFILMKI